MKIVTATTNRYRIIMAVISLMLFLTYCISPYEPDIQGKSGLLVVDGSIIKGRETQVIRISKTSPISQIEYLPVEGCNVRVMDNTGNEFVFDEESPGEYIAYIDDALLNYDKQYKLIFTTLSGDGYESDYQRLLETTPVDSLYGIPEYRYSSVTGEESTEVMQFYVDLDAPADASRYYRWVLEETWESHSDKEIWGIYNGQVIKRFYPSDSLYRCWKTKDVTSLYCASTINLSENRIKKVPLHFVESHSPKVSIKYCATVRQYALNADAYDYWFEKERELNESGNIYTIQPSQPKSNIHNTKNPDELVMGFFWVASCTVKHVFIKSLNSPEGFSCSSIVAYCESTNFDDIAACIYSQLIGFANDLTEASYFIGVQYGTQYSIYLTPWCVDCRWLGGVPRKPDFWE